MSSLAKHCCYPSHLPVQRSVWPSSAASSASHPKPFTIFLEINRYRYCLVSCALNPRNCLVQGQEDDGMEDAVKQYRQSIFKLNYKIKKSGSKRSSRLKVPDVAARRVCSTSFAILTASCCTVVVWIMSCTLLEKLPCTPPTPPPPPPFPARPPEGDASWCWILSVQSSLSPLTPPRQVSDQLRKGSSQPQSALLAALPPVPEPDFMPSAAPVERRHTRQSSTGSFPSPAYPHALTLSYLVGPVCLFCGLWPRD